MVALKAAVSVVATADSAAVEEEGKGKERDRGEERTEEEEEAERVAAIEEAMGEVKEEEVGEKAVVGKEVGVKMVVVTL